MRSFRLKLKILLFTFLVGLLSVNLIKKDFVLPNENFVNVLNDKANSVTFVVPVEEKQTFSRRVSEQNFINACPGTPFFEKTEKKSRFNKKARK